MSPAKSSRIVSRKLVFLYYYARLFNEEVLAHPLEIEEIKIQETNHQELNELTDRLGIEEDELTPPQATTAPIVEEMNDTTLESDIIFIAEYQLPQHTTTKVVKYDHDFVMQLASAYTIYRDLIASLIAPYTQRFSYEEMSLTRRALLLLWYAEHRVLSTPGTIIINEYVELAKNYEDAAAGKLINGIMHQMFGIQDKDKEKGQKQEYEINTEKIQQ